MKNKITVGIDIGGTHITSQLFDNEINRLIDGSETRIAVDNAAPKEEILKTWAKAIQQSISKTEIDKIAGIGFAMPGPFDYEKGIALFDKVVKKFQNLYKVDVRSEIINRLSLPADFPVCFVNDATAFAIGEANVKPAADYKRIIALTIGTGFGSTFIENGMPITGNDGIKGIPDDGFLYYAEYKDSIADEHFSSRWFTNQYKQLTAKTISGVKELVQLSETDPVAKQLFVTFGQNLGDFLSKYVINFKAEAIVLGGNISKSMPLFKEALSKELASNGAATNILKSVLDEDAALIGSAKYCLK